LMHKLPGLWPNLVSGTVASLGAFALTVLFVRWEGLRLEDVGAAPARRSLARFSLGFPVERLLVVATARLALLELTSTAHRTRALKAVFCKAG
jgi:hypothetical protein